MLVLIVPLLALAGPAWGHIRDFPLSDVTISDSTFQAKAAASNSRYLLDSLDLDRLLWSFRKNAGLPTPGTPYAGSWEDATCELRGHFTGHYLSAVAFLYSNTGDERALERLNTLVSELTKVQAALGGGYLSAFPTEHFDRLEALKGVWAPYYVIHKIMAGLVDAYELCGNKQALEVVIGMANYFHGRADNLIKTKGMTQWVKTLDTEFGGMNDIMYRLYRITKADTHLQLAQWFDKPWFWNGLKNNIDVLPYKHANTHLAQVVGFAEKYDTTDDPEAMVAVSNFFKIYTENHSFATGGSNWKEHWHAPSSMADAVLKQENVFDTHEICAQYNILKIARSLFRWTGDVKYADFYERALVNGILGVSRLSADEVMGQEEDNVKYLDSLLHKRLNHDHDHSHDHEHAIDAASTIQSADQAAETIQSAVQSRRLLAQGSDMADMHSIAGSQAPGVMWSASQAGSKTLLGEVDTQYVSEEHFFRAGAAGRHDEAKMYAASKAQEPSWIAKESGDLYNPPYAKGVPAGSVAPWQRLTSFKWFNYWSYNIRAQDPKGAINMPGTPGVFLYLLAMGQGVSKKENIHHWGYPFHSFWCCYGTAVESFAKLADSIYFWLPGKHVDNKQAGLGDDALDAELPVIFINQYVSSKVKWREMGVALNVKATMYGPGSTVRADMTLQAMQGARLASGVSDIPLVMKVRLPTWAGSMGKEKHHIQIEVNGKPWGWLDAASNLPGSYIDVVRRWKVGDTVRVTIPLAFSVMPIADVRPQYATYGAIMMGPYVMAGLTHDAHWISLASHELEPHVSDPPVAAQGLLSMQATLNASLYLRMDRYHTYVSILEDSGDALDATFILREGCDTSPRDDSSAASNADTTTSGRTTGQALLAQGIQVDSVVMLEAMGMPGFYLGALESKAGKVVWEQRPSANTGTDDSSGTGDAAGTRHPGDIEAGDGDAAAAGAAGQAVALRKRWCDYHSWRLVGGLDGSKDTFSLELVGAPGYYLSGVIAAGSQKCEDEDTDACSQAARKGLCVSEPESWIAKCPLSCLACKQIPAALHLVQIGDSASEEDKGWASWKWVAPAAPRYPPGAKVIKGVNRQFLLAPLGNLVDERYTVYFNVQRPAAPAPVQEEAAGEAEAQTEGTL